LQSPNFSAVRECVEKGVGFVVVISSGFKEIGAEGAELERSMVEAAEGTDTRIIGPNTTGIMNAENGLTKTFVTIWGPVMPGPVSFIVQTGLFAGTLLMHVLTAEKFGLCKVAGLGNKCDLHEAEVLDYLAQDKATKVIAMYIEGVSDGREFLRTAREAAKEKPVVILKSGRTEAGQRAALSHTGTLAGRDEIFDAVCRQCGLMRVRDFEEMLDLVKAFAMQPIPRGPKTGVASYTGAGCVIASDECALMGLELAELSEESRARLAKALPPWARPTHPIDLEPLHEAMGPDGYGLALEVLVDDPGVECVMANIMGLPDEMEGTLFYAGPEDFVRYFSKARERGPDKPIVVCISGDRKGVEASAEALEEAGFPVYPSIRRAIRALSALYKYSLIRKKLTGG